MSFKLVLYANESISEEVSSNGVLIKNEAPNMIYVSSRYFDVSSTVEASIILPYSSRELTLKNNMVHFLSPVYNSKVDVSYLD